MADEKPVPRTEELSSYYVIEIKKFSRERRYSQSTEIIERIPSEQFDNYGKREEIKKYMPVVKAEIYTTERVIYRQEFVHLNLRPTIDQILTHNLCVDSEADSYEEANKP